MSKPISYHDEKVGSVPSPVDEPYTYEAVNWPSKTVKVFHPTSGNQTRQETIKRIKETIQNIGAEDSPIRKYWKSDNPDPHYTYTSGRHFCNRHYCLMFAPGEYEDCDFQIGYYVQMIGLGASAHDVKFTGNSKSGPFVESLNKDLPYTPNGGTIEYPGSGLSLDTFWRSIENFSACSKSGLMWSVSQAAPVRRVYVCNGNLNLIDTGYASGGFIANAYIEKNSTIQLGGQQQWYGRHLHLAGNGAGASIASTTASNDTTINHSSENCSIDGVAWNLVLTGCCGDGVPKASPGVMPTPNPANQNATPSPGEKSISKEEAPVVRAEKPLVVLNTKKQQWEWELHVPNVHHSDNGRQEQVVGPQIDALSDPNEVRSFKNVKIVVPRPYDDINKDPDDVIKYNNLDEIDHQICNEIQIALDQGKDIILCPGTFFLTKSLIVKTKNQVILGLGLATLIAPKNGSPCIKIQENIPGIRVAGIQLEASVTEENKDETKNYGNDDGNDKVKCLLEVGDSNTNYEVMSLLEVGEPDYVILEKKAPKQEFDDDDDADKIMKANPIVLSDIFARVGGSNLNRFVSTDVMVRIHSNHVVGDNLWLWRADHAKLDSRRDEQPNDNRFPLYYQIREGQCNVKHALEVNGNHVKMYGLFCEHTTQHQLVWNGNYGHVSFYQCELPYDVTKKNASSASSSLSSSNSDDDYKIWDYAGYYVHDRVTHHTALGVGVYCNFTQDNIVVPSGIVHPIHDDGDKTTTSIETSGENKNNNITFQNAFTVFLSNKGAIEKTINKEGCRVDANFRGPSRV